MKALGEHYDLTAFDYVTGKINPLLLKPKSAVTPSSTGHSDGNKRKSTPNGNRFVHLSSSTLFSSKISCGHQIKY
jgi:hypothetical protein